MLTLSVIDVESGTGLRLLDFLPTVAYLSQFLPFFDQYALSHRIWAPDSSAIVLPVREDDANRILVVPVGGGRPYRLAEGEIAFWSHN
jgi:TolB protein